MRDEVPAFDESLVEAEEDFVIDAQFLIQELLDERGMSRAELARKIGVSKARLTQMMRPDANPTLRTVARILHALGEKARLARQAPAAIEDEACLPGRVGPSSAAWFEGVHERVERFRTESASATGRAFRSMFERQEYLVGSSRSKPFDILKAANDCMNEHALPVAI